MIHNGTKDSICCHSAHSPLDQALHLNSPNADESGQNWAGTEKASPLVGWSSLALCGEPLMSQDPTLGKPFLQDSSLLCCAVVTIWWIKDGKIRRRLTAASEINILLTFRFQICQTVDPSVVSGKAP